MDLSLLKETDLTQFTGCNFKVVTDLEKQLERILHKKRGRPFKHSIKTILLTALIKFRSDLPYRTLEFLLNIDAVTISRYVLTACKLLTQIPLQLNKNYDYLIVDCTGNRVRSRDLKNFSGHKHYTSRRVQAVVTDGNEIVDISTDYHGSAHDKTIWNKEYRRIEAQLDKIILADKAYAGCKGENQQLFRPFKHNETEYKNNHDQTKAYNRELSKIRVKVEHVFAQLKHFKILSGIFSLKSTRYGLVVKALAVIYNSKLQAK